MAKPPIIADLHTHSTCSDGELAPEALIDLAAQAGLEVLALTDHDTLAGVEAATAQGKLRGIEVIPGCELTVYEGSIELHVLALFVDTAANSPFAELLVKTQQARYQRGLTSAAQLRAAGIAIDDADVLAAAGKAQSIGRPHIAAALVQRGHARSVPIALAKFLQPGQPGFVSKYTLKPEDGFAAIHASGGLAILAHPGANPHDELIAPFFRRGLDGVEAYAATHAEINRRYYAGLARRYEKLVSGGSDYHGPTLKPGLLPGASGVDRTTLAALRRAAEARRRG